MRFIARLAAIFILIGATPAFACTEPASVCTQDAKGSFPLISGGKPAAILIEASANSAVKLASASFANDLQRVSGQKPELPSDRVSARGVLIIAGVALMRTKMAARRAITLMAREPTRGPAPFASNARGRPARLPGG